MLSELTSREASLYAMLMQTPLFIASMMGVSDWFPPVSTVISNVPGPKEQLYWNGAPLLGSYPVSAVFHGFALNITFVSYHGNLDFGIIACRHTVPHVQRLIDYLEQSLSRTRGDGVGHNDLIGEYRCQIPTESRATKENDHTREMASQRAFKFIEAMTGAKLDTVASYTIDPAVTNGNIENFIGTAQVPIGIAGPLTMVGEHAKGDFYIPMATTEGTLVASYSRGMRVISECGGARTTVVKHSMQRAPVFLFDNALEAREFGKWLERTHRCASRRRQGFGGRAPVDGDRAICRRQHAVHAILLYDRRRGRPEHDRQSHAVCLRVDTRNHPATSRATSCPATSIRTRSTR